MYARKTLTCRRTRWARPWAIATMVTMALMTNGGSLLSLPTTVSAQSQAAPVNQGFHIVAEDLRFIYKQILVAQDHAAGGSLVGLGPNQIDNPQLPKGLRTVDGSMNNLVPGQEKFGAADLVFPRLLPSTYRSADTLPFDPDGPGGQAQGQATSYGQKSGFVSDSQPRLISNLIVDQTSATPAAVAAADNPCGSGGFVCSGNTAPDPVTGSLFIPNITPDFGLSAPFNLMFTFFGQFFDHGLDLVTKGGGTVLMPLQPDDPLFVPGSQTNFMAMTRGQNQPGPDGILGTADDVQESMNTTTPWVDQNQTYTSHPAHQVFLRMYAKNAAGKPVQTGKMLDGDHCTPRPTGIAGDDICNIGNWGDVKRQASTILGIHLVDTDVFDVPMILTDPYGHFKPGPNGFPQLVLSNGLLEGNPAANGGLGVTIPGNALHTGHAFLNDIAHNAVPNPGLVPDADTTIRDFRNTADPQPPGTYDDELLAAHFITGDGRGNENIALSMVHQIFHAEHNRLVVDIDRVINAELTPQEIADWHAVHPGSGWDYNERLFQAARFCTEMQYQHLVFEEFARKMQPLINPFLGGLTSINGAISAEFAHTVYRLGHSMLPEVVNRINADGSNNDSRLFNVFLNPPAYNNGGTAGTLNAAQAAGSIVRGLSRQVGNELDEFVTDSVRNTLVGLPLDLAAINIARGRSEGIPSLNNARKGFFGQSRDTSVKPYANWFEFGQNLKHVESLVNFVAAYGTDPTITSAPTMAGRRAAAATLVAASGAFMFAPSTTSGLDNVDFWVGGLAERQNINGGLLGSTFNFVFEHQLEHLQDGDRFYYLQRTDGLDLRFQLEGNSFAELIRRNTDFSGGMDVIFDAADFIFDGAALIAGGNAPIDLGGGIQLISEPDGTKLFFDPLHRGKNIEFDGGPGNDKFKADIGDDTLYGNDGNDRLDGMEGNDRVEGGNGDDVLFGGAGDDVLKGGPGNDALSTGPGFGGDIAIGGDGNDFIVGGDDGVEYFGGPGNDIIIDGAMRSEGMFAGPGDDWIYDGEGHDGGIFGDNGNVFDLLAGLDPVGGDDVLGGGPGQDNHFGEGGDDIMLMSEGSNKFFGDFGFDWITQRGWPAPADIELDLLAVPGVILNLNDLRNMYRYVDGASGWDLDDHIRGDSRVDDPTVAPELQNLPGMELTTAGAAKIAGLTELLGPAGFNIQLPWKQGNILLGGGGRDVIEGKGGNDLIDGDRWLDVQLVGTLNDGTVKTVWDPRDLIDDVFADPQRLNPGNIRIQRTIRLGAPAVDTAVFSGARAEYTVTLNPNGSVTVAHTNPAAANLKLLTGTDTLLNVEVLQFANTSIAAPGAKVAAVPATLANQTPAVAGTRIATAGLTVGTTSFAPSTTVAPGRVIGSDPPAGTWEFLAFPVNLIVSSGTPGPVALSITSPTAGNTLTGTLNITASSPNLLAGVQFMLDGAPFKAEDVAAPYSVSWNTTAGTDGPHVLSAVGRDAAGNTVTAFNVPVTVANDPIPPVVSMIDPAVNGAILDRALTGRIDISADATDNVGVVGVQFLLDGIPLGAEKLAAPWTRVFAASAFTVGPHTLAAVARDRAGNTATSAPVSVIVK